jgi:hypothetical protein
MIATNGGNQSWTGLTKRFDPSRFDLLFVLTGSGRRWLIPADAIEARNQLTLGGPRYSEFEIEAAASIAQLVYGADRPTLESENRPGEYPSGQRTAAVNRQAMPSQVRILPPPSTRTAASASGDSTRFERALGRSGQALVRPKRQTTIPKRAFVDAGLRVGDRMRIRADGEGRIVFERIQATQPTLDSLDAA